MCNLRADVCNRFCSSDECPNHDDKDCCDCPLHKILEQLDEHLALRQKIRDDIRHFESEVVEHNKLCLSSRRVALQHHHAGQREAYKHLVKHLKGYL